MNLNSVYTLSMPSLLSGTCLQSRNWPTPSLKNLTTCTLTRSKLSLASHRGPTPAILHSIDGLGFPRISELYLESHTLAYARCMVKADDRVLHVIKCKLDREAKWKRKKTKFGSVRWHDTSKQAIEQSSSDDPKWSAVKKLFKPLSQTTVVLSGEIISNPLFSREIFSKSSILSSVMWHEDL